MANTVAELVFIPAPGIGHIMSTVEMAKLLVTRDKRLFITVLLINPPYSSLALTTYIDSLGKNAIERIRFIDLPQDQTTPKLDPKSPISSFYEFINSHCKHVKNIISNHNASGRRVVGFVVDILCTGMIDVADELNVPTYVFFTSNAAFLGFKLHIESLCLDNNQDHVIELSNSGAEVLVPSFLKPVPMKVFPSVYKSRDGLDFLMSSIGKMRRAKGIMINTFLELETHAIKSFSGTNFPQVYPVGPVLNFAGVSGKPEDKLDLFSWLDAQPPSSVVLLCFGSYGSFDEVQVKEIASALERSGYRFVWSLRRPPQLEKAFQALPDDYDSPELVLPDGFLDQTKGLGKVIGWAPQVSLLAHKAIGGFVSHCGWNSMLESLWFGVPTATWPVYSEQQINAFEMVVELGLAVDLKLDYKFNVFNPEGDTMIVTSDEIEKGIRRVMEDNEVRAKVKEISKMSRAAVTLDGSSYASVESVVQYFMSTVK